MRVNELSKTSQPRTRDSVCVLIAIGDDPEQLRRCVESVQRHTPPDTPVLTAPATAAAVNRALERLAPADTVLLSEPCRVTPGWLERLQDAACSDTNTATASAVADVGGELALSDADGAGESFPELAQYVSEHTLRLRPRLNRAVGPCIYVRRAALELVGALDENLDLRWSLDVDFAQRCVLSGLAHVAADDVVIERLAAQEGSDSHEIPTLLLERYPYLSERSAPAESSVLSHALEATRRPRGRLWVTLDARALEGAVTGTRVHILELIVALAQTGALRLRLLVRESGIGRETLELLRGLPETELLDEEDVDETAPRSPIYHRPQQTFAAEDVEFAVRLGERIVLSQLDLIAYRNPGYFPDAAAWEDYRRASRHGLSAADRVVVFSDHTRRELLSDALVDAPRIRVVPPGLDHRAPGAPRRPGALDEGAAASLAAGFLLCLGTDFRHKNRLFALRLLASLRARHDWQGCLVLAGTHIPHGSSLELERAFLREHDELGEAVVALGSVDEQEKAWLIANAGAVVYPSVYEGFGLVPFEAALNGVPCIFAPWSSLAENTPPGTATILPWDAAASATAVLALLRNDEIRAHHIRALAAAAASLTWAATAASMVEVYREAAVAPVRDAATLSRDAVDRERSLTAEHQSVVETLIGERELVLGDYRRLLEDLGPGRGLIGLSGSLPDDLQRALLTLSAHPALSRPLYGALARLFVVSRVISRTISSLLRQRR
jgi:glycosyltransferase involved in cell wall biosynthesis